MSGELVAMVSKRLVQELNSARAGELSRMRVSVQGGGFDSAVASESRARVLGELAEKARVQGEAVPDDVVVFFEGIEERVAREMEAFSEELIAALKEDRDRGAVRACAALNAFERVRAIAAAVRRGVEDETQENVNE